MESSAVRTLESGEMAVYSFTWPAFGDADAEAQSAVALMVNQRQGGFLICLPMGFLPPDAFLDDTLVGPHNVFTVPAVAEVEGSLIRHERDLEVQVVDMEDSALLALQPLDPEDLEHMAHFGGDPSLRPDPETLKGFVREWVTLQQIDLGEGFYSAVGENVAPGPPAPKAPAKAKAKRMTMATLAEQLNQVAQLLPALSSQVQDLQRHQEDMQAALNVPKLPLRPSQVAVSAPLQKFAMSLGTPPRAKSAALICPPKKSSPPMPVLNEEEDIGVAAHAPADHLAQAVYEQSRALTTLVASLSGDPLLDTSASSGAVSLSSRGSQSREKLQKELSQRNGAFFNQVMQNAYRRMRPAARLPSSPQEALAHSEFSMVNYLERFGGYGGQRELGLVQFCLAHIFDCAMNEDWEGVKEHLALTMTAVEQSVQDAGRWDLAFPLTLLEEPASQMWSYKNSMVSSRARAFAPLCPQKWATVALAYLKEVDYIHNRRLEMNKKPSSPPQLAQNSQQKEGASQKKKGKGRGRGGQPADSNNASSAD